MTSIGWWHKIIMDGTDTLEVRTFGVAPGDRIGAGASPYAFDRADSSAFHVIAIRSSGSVLIDSKSGLVPEGQRSVSGFAHRFIVTAGPVVVGTLSSDAGEVIQLRTVPERLAKERLRNGTARRSGGSMTTIMGKPYTPKPDTTFDQPPRLLAQVPAWLPKPWRRSQSDRLVYVMAVVDTNGHISNPKLAVTNPPDIETAILEAAKHFKFEPARKRNRPVIAPWGFNVELKHPRSGELAEPEDSSSTAEDVGRKVSVRIRASAYYDSVDEEYCYSYALENRSKGPARVTSLTLMGCATDVQDEFEAPEKWNGYVCGSSPGVQGWIIWEKEPAEGRFGYATKPGAWLAPMKFKSRARPGRVRWLARMATDKSFPNTMPCSPSELDASVEGSLSGTIMGPVPSAPGRP